MEHTIQIAEKAHGALSTATAVMIFGLIAALIVGNLAAAYITRSITKPVNKIIPARPDGPSVRTEQGSHGTSVVDKKEPRKALDVSARNEGAPDQVIPFDEEDFKGF